MKLFVFFGDETDPKTPAHIVDWSKNPVDYYKHIKMDGKYWEFICYKKADITMKADYVLIYGEVRASSIPCDIYGRQDIFNFDDMLSFNKGSVCECGAEKVYGKNTGHATWCPLWRRA
jgi:hypothetical protein